MQKCWIQKGDLIFEMKAYGNMKYEFTVEVYGKCLINCCRGTIFALTILIDFFFCWTICVFNIICKLQSSLNKTIIKFDFGKLC